MIKLVVFAPRKKGITKEEFHQHWKAPHGLLFASQPEVKKYVKKYQQLHSTGEQLGGDFPTVSEYDGIAIMWFDSMDDIKRVFGSNNIRTIIAKDEEKFIDRENARWMYTVEHEIPIEGA